MLKFILSESIEVETSLVARLLNLTIIHMPNDWVHSTFTQIMYQSIWIVTWRDQQNYFELCCTSIDD